MSLSGGSTSQDSYAQNKYAKINRELWNDYKTRYSPVESRAISAVQDKPLQRAEAIDRANTLNDTAYDSSVTAAEQEQARYGGMTADQRKSFDKRVSLGHAASTVNNRNTVRKQVDDRLLGLEGSMVSVGRAKEGQAVSGFGTAAQLEQRRNSVNRSIDAQNDASKYQLAGSLAGIGLAAAI